MRTESDLRVALAALGEACHLRGDVDQSATHGTAGLALHREVLPDTEGVADSAASKPFTNWSIRSAPISG